MRGSTFLTEFVNRSLVDLSTLNVLMSARPVVSITNCTSTSPSTPALSSMLGYCGFGLSSLANAGFSTWNSKYVWSGFTGPLPPTTPFDVPPSTPLPEKSASLVTAFDRSTSGILVGMLIGGVSTWKPLGGGGVTVVCGGGGFGGSGFGGGALVCTNLTSSSRCSFSFRSPAFSVTATASPISAACKMMLAMTPPGFLSRLGLDSSSVVNMLDHAPL